MNRETWIVTALVTASQTVIISAAILIGQEASDPARTQSLLKKRFVDSVESVEQLKPQTDSAKAKAKFYDGYGAEMMRPGEHVKIGGGLPVAPRSDTRTTAYESYVQRLICSSDRAVVGTAKPARVLMNNRETFLFTEHVVAVEMWLRPARNGPETIDVVTAGGRVRIGNKLTVADNGQDLYTGDRYFLMLKHVPGTEAFAVVGEPIRDEPSWTAALRHSALPDQLRVNAIPFDQFVQDLYRVSSQC